MYDVQGLDLTVIHNSDHSRFCIIANLVHLSLHRSIGLIP